MTVLRTHARLRALAGSAVLAAALTVSERASACGGFWCSQTAPVEQTGEQIIFVQNGDGTVTCVINIAYQGHSEHFAWVLPVEGVPQIGVINTRTGMRRTVFIPPSTVARLAL